MKLYDKLPDMECLAGDTLPTFVVSVESGEIIGCRMQVILARTTDLSSEVLCKECTPESGGFSVTLTSEDTEPLAEGMYHIHFRLIGADGMSRRKLSGLFYVHSAAKGED